MKSCVQSRPIPPKNLMLEQSSPLQIEYMLSGRATEKTYVYSLGVLMLEVISGKQPTDASFIEKGLNIVARGGKVSRYVIGGADLMFPCISIGPEGLPEFSAREIYGLL